MLFTLRLSCETTGQKHTASTVTLGSFSLSFSLSLSCVRAVSHRGCGTFSGVGGRGGGDRDDECLVPLRPDSKAASARAADQRGARSRLKRWGWCSVETQVGTDRRTNGRTDRRTMDTVNHNQAKETAGKLKSGRFL